ncbi:MAG: NAD(P)-dependent oxidoreductase [Woeseiaceae bacterium]|jgi:3-hydroxyisobutyrate dehydrogenase-like beta-hydroxyacid dehydrogenase|nr:NAD(P)-dependent oxidoreductase [Woeseiaceae bacterium]MDG1015480.1 NAD(P)-dependent oxidoreductase [Woeseiaceae bacterium]MDG1865376.1 NAD(P)-dependent oxidoreductase [Woeseiaceae bacterium]
MNLSFIGLGVMGYPMAGFLANAGYQVTVFNRTESKAKKWSQEFKGSYALTPLEASKNADIIFTCVGNDDDVRQVILGPKGVIHGLKNNAIVVDHTTASSVLAEELDNYISDAGGSFIDAPLSGGQAGAESGQLTIMVGGEEAIFTKVSPVMNNYAKACTLIGGVGSGQKAKMVNQICIAGLVQGLAEGLHFAKREKLNIEAVINAISKGAAQSWQMENRWQTMIKDEFEFGFAVEWMRKDLEIALDEANRIAANIKVTALVNEYYKEIESIGGKRFDTSSLIKRLEP